MSICHVCQKNLDICDCEQCRECSQLYEFEDLKDGFCPDCHADYDSMDLEDKIDKLLTLT